MLLLKDILNLYKLNIFDAENLAINPNYGTDKGHPKSYIDKFYEEFFRDYRDRNNIIVEIGVRSGASLKLWSEYFSKESSIFGLDNLHDKTEHAVPVNNEWISSKNVEYIVGDAYSTDISDKFEKIDILIDDGPHTIESHIKLIELYASKISKGGAIIIEDVGYDPEGILEHIPQSVQDKFSYFDFGTYCDNKIILFKF